MKIWHLCHAHRTKRLLVILSCEYLVKVCSIISFAVQIFEEEKIHQLLTIGDYPLYLIPLDEDVLSFELDLAYKVWINSSSLADGFQSQNRIPSSKIVYLLPFSHFPSSIGEPSRW